MTQFWNENKWYIITVLAAVVAAFAYALFAVPAENLLPNDYSVM